MICLLDSTKVPFILSHVYHAHVLHFFPHTVLTDYSAKSTKALRLTLGERHLQQTGNRRELISRLQQNEWQRPPTPQSGIAPSNSNVATGIPNAELAALIASIVDEWMNQDVQLYLDTFPGLPKSGCCSCGSTDHLSDTCPLSPRRSRDALTGFNTWLPASLAAGLVISKIY